MLTVEQIDFSLLWLWLLAFIRIEGVLSLLPGVGSEQVPLEMRTLAAIAISIPIAFSGATVALPESLLQGLTVVTCEYLLGVLLGMIPIFALAGLGVAGQIAAGAMGLSQGNMMDPSLGERVTLLSRFNTLLGTLVFLFLDGHLVVLEAAMGVSIDPNFGKVPLSLDAGPILLERLKVCFEFSLIICAPIIATLLITQFVLALMTRFVPQINIFVSSLALTIGVGLFIVAYSIPGMVKHTTEQYTSLEEIVTEFVKVESP